MKRLVRTITFVVAGLLIGWALGQAQTSAPDFELIVNAQGGETSVWRIRS
jgi:hypothetical protein